MDAKPQRPRGFTRIRDENLAPSNVSVLKTIHQRNKSTPALTALLKPLSNINPSQPRRAAFADVSNTLRPGPVAKDDLIVGLKPVNDKLIHRDQKSLKDSVPALSLHSFKSATHLRPAQRPLSSLLSKTSTIPLKSVAPKTSISALNGAILPAIPDVSQEYKDKEITAVKPVAKRQTTVLKDSEPVQIIAPITEASTAPNPVTTAQPAMAPSVTAKQLPKLPLSEDQQKQDVASYYAAPASAPMTITHEAMLAVIQPHHTALPQPGSTSFVHPTGNSLPQQLPLAELVNTNLLLPAIPETKQNLESTHFSQPAVAEPLLEEKVALPTEENWDDDEEEEFFDAEGFTTARSFRSKGDTMTNQTVFLLEPRTNDYVKLELQEATDYVQCTRLESDFEEECWDMSMVAEYSEEIFLYMRELEETYRPNPYYMDNQTEIQWSMRSVLVDWITQVHGRFQMLPETLFLAVNYVDRFLSVKIVSIGKLQLVGACALFIAAKYEEISCPSVGEMVFMVDKGYTVEEILKAERFMLSMLKYECGWPGPMSFLRRISKADDYDLETRTLAKYFLEVTLMDERFVASVPSFTAAASHCLARLMLKKGNWTQSHVYYSGYTYWQLQHVMTVIAKCCRNPQRHHGAIYEKYIDKRYKRAALFAEGEVRKGFQVPWVEMNTGTVNHLSLLRCE